MRNYKEFVKNETEGFDYLADLGDYDLYKNEENDVKIIQHENCVSWDIVKKIWLDEEELIYLKSLINCFEDAEDSDESDEVRGKVETLLGLN